MFLKVHMLYFLFYLIYNNLSCYFQFRSMQEIQRKRKGKDTYFCIWRVLLKSWRQICTSPFEASWSLFGLKKLRLLKSYAIKIKLYAISSTTFHRNLSPCKIVGSSLQFVFCSSGHDNIESDILCLWRLSASLHKRNHRKEGKSFQDLLWIDTWTFFKHAKCYCVLHVVLKPFLLILFFFFFAKNNSFSISVL